MPTNLVKFNAALEKAEGRIQGDFEKFYRQVCLEVLTRVVMRTAVDTGRARGNWQLEINNPASGVVDTEGPEAIMTDLAISAAITKLGQIPPFSIVHITNNIEYIYYLEYVRRSPQHPEGMLEITLTEMESWLSGINTHIK